MNLNEAIKKDILSAQKSEITEHFVYDNLSRTIKDSHNKEILKQISQDELRHYNFWKKHTEIDVAPNRLKMWFYSLISKVFGVVFTVKLMENSEGEAQEFYGKMRGHIEGIEDIIKDEHEHEKRLIAMIKEARLDYMGSVVLGLNDALVELTGVLAGLTLTLQNRYLVAIVGLITGIAASLSMAASEYFATKAEKHVDRSPVRAAIYTGFAYIVTVLFLIFPYFVVESIYLALALTILNAILVIFVFTGYTSVVEEIPFKKRFFEMLIISLGVAFLSFVIGFLLRKFIDISAL